MDRPYGEPFPPRTGGGGAPVSTGGYSRRTVPGDAKSNDRHRLLTDKAAYISFLEAQAERANAIRLEAQEVGVGLHSMKARMDELEEKVRSTVRTVELVQDHGVRAGESARAGRSEMEDQLRVLESRSQRLEVSAGDARATTDAEMARMRNEVALAVQELGQRVDDRIQAIRAWRFEADEGAAGIIREAQATCVRLADDALSALEASQHKLDELSKRTEAGLQVLHVDVTALKAELAGVTRHSLHRSNHIDAVLGLASSAAATDARRGAEEDATSVIADAVERRLGARWGQQVLQLSEVLRRVVQAQGTLQQQVSGSSFPNGGLVRAQSPAPLPLAAAPLLSTQVVDVARLSSNGFSGASPAPLVKGVATAASAGVNVDTHRRAAIDDLYEELRRLEECDIAMKKSTSRSVSPGVAARRPRSTRTARAHQ